MFDPLNQNGDDEIDFSEKNLFEGLPVDEICKNTVDFPEEEFKKPEKEEEEKKLEYLGKNNSFSSITIYPKDFNSKEKIMYLLDEENNYIDLFDERYSKILKKLSLVNSL